MSESGNRFERFYLQDELGSPIRLMSDNRELEESYGHDEFGQDLYGNHGIVQPFGYTGYQADLITGTYYAQAREYRPEQGRFGALDTIKGFTAVPYTLNEYGYCWNNPERYVDLEGAWPSWVNTKNVIIDGIDAVGKAAVGSYNDLVDYYKCLVKDFNGTVTFKISANATAYVGAYIDLGLSFDWKGNAALQYSYVIPGVDDTLSIGLFDIGVTGGVAFTDASDVYGLLGKSSSIGASGGYLGYGAVDLISFEEMEDMNGDVDGLQIGAGVGAGIDIHMMESYTREIFSFNVFQGVEKTFDFLLEKIENERCIEKQ